MRLVRTLYINKEDFIHFLNCLNRDGFITDEQAKNAGNDWDNYATVEDIIDDDDEMSDDHLCDIIAIDYKVGWDKACDIVNDYIHEALMKEIEDANDDVV
jgi:hypothetical protein